MCSLFRDLLDPILYDSNRTIFLNRSRFPTTVQKHMVLTGAWWRLMWILNKKTTPFQNHLVVRNIQVRKFTGSFSLLCDTRREWIQERDIRNTNCLCWVKKPERFHWLRASDYMDDFSTSPSSSLWIKRSVHTQKRRKKNKTNTGKKKKK